MLIRALGKPQKCDLCDLSISETVDLFGFSHKQFLGFTKNGVEKHTE